MIHFNVKALVVEFGKRSFTLVASKPKVIELVVWTLRNVPLILLFYCPRDNNFFMGTRQAGGYLVEKGISKLVGFDLLSSYWVDAYPCVTDVQVTKSLNSRSSLALIRAFGELVQMSWK